MKHNPWQGIQAIKQILCGCHSVSCGQREKVTTQVMGLSGKSTACCMSMVILWETLAQQKNKIIDQYLDSGSLLESIRQPGDNVNGTRRLTSPSFDCTRWLTWMVVWLLLPKRVSILITLHTIAQGQRASGASLWFGTHSWLLTVRRLAAVVGASESCFFKYCPRIIHLMCVIV